MNTPCKKILILSSGGDAPGMNAAIRAAVRTARHHAVEIFGSEGGFRGLVEQKIRPLTAESVGNCISQGGTILKTARCQRFMQADVRSECRQFLIDKQFDGLIVLGGDGSFRGAQKLVEGTSLLLVGIPCTIDNDITNTDYTLGFDTALNTALKSIDNVRDTALSHDRNFIVEVMGRDSGFLAMEVGVAGGAEIILIPEFPMSTQQIVDKLKRRHRHKTTSIIVAAEGGRTGHSLQLAKDIRELSGIEYKVCILGHTQRGGAPTVKDRYIGSIMGYKAVLALLNNQANKMTALINQKVEYVDFPSEENSTRYFTDQELIKFNEVICEM